MADDYSLAVRGDEINTVLATVQALYPEFDRQLMVLASSLAVMCKAAGLTRNKAVKAFADVFDQEIQIKVTP